MPDSPAGVRLATIGPSGGTIATPWRALLLGLVGVAIFAGTLPATRLAVVSLAPEFVAFGRAVVAGILAAVALALTRQRRPRGREFAILAAIALCLVVGFPFFSGLAMERVPASHGGVVLAVLPLGTAIAATLFGAERPGLVFWGLSIAGGALVLLYALSGAGWTLLTGDLFLLSAAASAALGYALSGRLARTMAGWAVISWALVIMLPATALASWLSAPDVWPTSPVVWSAFAYLGAGSMFLGFFFWNNAMARGGIAKIGQLQLLQPFMTIAIAALFTAEAFVVRDLGFAALIVVVVAFAQRAKVRRR